MNIGASFITLNRTWAQLKSVVAGHTLALRCEEEAPQVHLFALDGSIIYLCTLWRGAVPHAVPLSQGDNDAALADYDTNFAPKANGAVVRRATSGFPATETRPRTGSKVQILSQNFCDRHTWYSTSARRTAVAMVDSGTGLTWTLASPPALGGVDVTHGRLPHERRVRATYRPVVKVNGTAKVEKDPHDNVGDYTVDYATMSVTFGSSQAGATVTLDYSEVIDSRWYLKPAAGKRLRLISAELQFSVDARMEDTFMFQPRGDVAKFTALAAYWDANGGPYPAGTMLPLGDPVCYQTVFDLIAEANLAYHPIPALKHAVPTWRDTVSDVVIFPWEYGEQATIDVSDGVGSDVNDIEISLEHHTEMTGSHAVVTFYCLSEDA